MRLGRILYILGTLIGAASGTFWMLLGLRPAQSGRIRLLRPVRPACSAAT